MITDLPSSKKKLNEYKKSLQNYTLPSEKDDAFRIHYHNECKDIQLGISGENSIIFIMKGGIFIKKDSEYDLYDKNSMLFISKAFKPYEATTKEGSIFIELKSENLLPFIDQVLLNQILSLYAPNAIELERLYIKKTLRYFLSGIIYYRRNNIFSKYIYDIKKTEFIFLMRTLYDKQALARFFSPILLCQNQFRMDVLANYSYNSSVKDLARKCFMTTKTFTRRFKAEFGITPYKWIIHQKVKSLEYYLVHKTRPIENILEEFNFSNTTEFIAFCNKHNLDSKLLNK